uniref:Uncharacterized protein n=1 Tax=Entomoneis paludosa TaxID=265537 RepID=A0A7S2VBW6_9STRA
MVGSTAVKSSRSSSNQKSNKSMVEEPPQLINTSFDISPGADNSDSESSASSSPTIKAESMAENKPDVIPDGEPIRPQLVLTTVWNYVLGTAALVDFVAAWMHQRQTDRLENGEEVWEPSNNYEEFTATLAANFSNLGLIFSLLWFVDSFVTARNSWLNSQKEIEKRRVLGEKELGPSWLGLEKPTEAYLRTILIQVLLLPVGFYVTLFSVAVTYVTGGDVKEYFQWSTAEEHTHRFHLRIPLRKHHDETDETEEDPLTRYANFSLVVAAVHFTLKTIGKIIKKEGQRRAKAVGVHVARRALRKPLRFSRQLKKFLSYLRWVKYLLPIIATSNKFLQNFLDLLKKMKQKRDAYIARKMRRALFKERTPQEQREWAAIKMQKAWRAKQSLRYANAVKLFQGHREMMAAKRLQDRFRAKLEKARERIRKKKEELAALKKKEQEAQAKNLPAEQEMDDNDKARMYRLQKELKNHTDYIINKMLIRPNIPFVVWWKAAFVFAVIFEISGNILKPRLKRKHGYDSYNSLVEDHVVPNRWASLPVCNPKPKKLTPHEKMISEIAQMANKTRFTRNLLHLDNDKSFFVIQKPPPPELPWYCSKHATDIQGGFCSSMEFVIEHFDMFLAFVFFLDVFISFFTGVLDEETGVLKPPGFFPRYILPGVLLQCIVNPQMETTAKILKFFVTELLLLGPVRVTRWAVALVVPLLLFSHNAFQEIRRRIAYHKTGGLV